MSFPLREFFRRLSLMVFPAKLKAEYAGYAVPFRDTTVRTTTATAWVTLIVWPSDLWANGNFLFRAHGRFRTTGAATAFLRALVNGRVVEEWSTTSTSPVEVISTVRSYSAFSALGTRNHDVVEWQMRTSDPLVPAELSLAEFSMSLPLSPETAPEIRIITLDSGPISIAPGAMLKINSFASFTPTTTRRLHALTGWIGVAKGGLVEADIMLSTAPTRDAAAGPEAETIFAHSIHKHADAPYADHTTLVFPTPVLLTAGRTYRGHGIITNAGTTATEAHLTLFLHLEP